MALQSITEIFIGRNSIPSFKKITLQQHINDHHNLELVCRMDVLERLSSELGEESKHFLGETITLRISPIGALSGYEKLEFRGIVTQIKIVKSIAQNTGDEIIIIANSPTILADDGSHYASHMNKPLTDIIDKTFTDYDQSKLKIKINPKFKKAIHYSVQYNESCFNYTSRLAAQYGEWFYYDGLYLNFGLNEDKEVILKYLVDLKEFQLSLLPQPNAFKYHSNNYLLDEIHEIETKSISPETNGYNGFLSTVSNDIFGNETTILHNPFVDNEMLQRLNTTIEIQKKALEINQVKFTGTSDNPDISLGCIISSKEAGEDKYRVISVIHTCNESGNYENNFEAISASFDAYPYTNIRAFPKSQSQIGIVKENHDPEALGRVKVQFPWQEKTGETTPWIRIVSLHAGSGKGFYCVPELDEEVLVGFEGGNAETPYVMGSLYNANSKPPSNSSTPNNDITIIMTRSGCCLTFNDNSNTLTITNRFTCDENNTQITLKGDGTIIINAELDVNITAEGSISLDAPTINIGNESASPDLTNIHGKTIHIHASQLLELLSDIDLKAKGANVDIIADAIAKLKGLTTTIQGDALTEIKGAQVKMN